METITRIRRAHSQLGSHNCKAESPNRWLIAFAVLTVLSAAIAEAQPKQAPRIGYLAAAPFSAIKERTEAFRQGLRDLGYVEGKNIVIEWRSSESKRDRAAVLAAELVSLKVDVIVAAGAGATRPAKAATTTIPIVMASDDDPIANGFVASLARPGGNITGLSTLAPELSGKRLELLKETIPKLARIAVFGSSSNTAANRHSIKEAEFAAGALGIKVQYIDILAHKDFEPAFQAAKKGNADAVLMLVSGPIISPHRTEVAALAIKNRLPVTYERTPHVEAGGLMTYGVHLPDLDRRAAIYVDKILKGAKPGDLPIEQPTKFEFVINLKTAKQIGLTIPPNVLARADRVIR